jgi:hypothetical protein
MAAAAAAQSRSRIASICARTIAAVIPGAKYTQPEQQVDGTTEFSPSRRHRVGRVNRYTRHNSPWDSEGEWSDETVNEEEQPHASLCCGIIRTKNTESMTAVTIQVPLSGRVIVYSAAFMAGLDASLMWASLPFAVAASANVNLPWVGVVVCFIAAAHSFGQLFGAALIWHGRFRPLGHLKPLSMLLLGQLGLVVSFTALAASRNLVWIGCARLVGLICESLMPRCTLLPHSLTHNEPSVLLQLGGMTHSQLSAAHVLMGKLVKRACREHRLMDHRAARNSAEEAATEIWQWWAVGGACGCGLGMALSTMHSQPLLPIAVVAALVALAVLVMMVVLIARDPASPLPALMHKCRRCRCCCCCCPCGISQQSSKDGYSALSRTDEDTAW